MTMKASDMEITADSVMNTKAYVDPDKLKDAQMEITGTTTTGSQALSRLFRISRRATPAAFTTWIWGMASRSR